MRILKQSRRTGLSGTTTALLVLGLLLTILHHADHVLRVDHSGWPFRPVVTPFTFSLLAYPMILFALLGRRRLIRERFAFLAIGTVLTLLAHAFIESRRCSMRCGPTIGASTRTLPGCTTWPTSGRPFWVS